MKYNVIISYEDEKIEVEADNEENALDEAIGKSCPCIADTEIVEIEEELI